MEQGNVQTAVVTDEKAELQTAEQEGKSTFTQEEVNEMVKIRLRNMPNEEELKEFRSWKESQKTEAEKSVEKDQEIANLKLENARLTNANLIANSDVDLKFQKFVLSEVSAMEGEFNTNLQDYLKSNPQYLVAKVSENSNVTTGVNQNNANTGVSEEKSYLDKKYANNPYYKK